MTTFNYASSAATAAALLQKFGQPVTLSRIVPGGYDPETGTVAPDTEQTQAARAAVLPYRDGDKFAAGMVKIGDRRILIAPGVQWAPDATTKLTEAGGAVWQLENVEALAPAGVTVLFKANGTK